jgi:hypothetical protein
MLTTASKTNYGRRSQRKKGHQKAKKIWEDKVLNNDTKLLSTKNWCAAARQE